MDRHQAGHAAALFEFGADHVAGTLGSRQDHVDVLGGFDVLEVDVESMREDEGLALLQVRQDVGLIDLGLDFVRQQDLDEVGLFSGFGGGEQGHAGLEAVLDGELVVVGALALAHDHVDARVAQVLRLGMALRSVADHGDRLVLEGGQRPVLVRVDLHRKLPRVDVLVGSGEKVELFPIRHLPINANDYREPGNLQLSPRAEWICG